jgi:tRNA threonylcarbamoyladenosine biosynthesis protein TsaE
LEYLQRRRGFGLAAAESTVSIPCDAPAVHPDPTTVQPSGRAHGEPAPNTVLTASGDAAPDTTLAAALATALGGAPTEITLADASATAALGRRLADRLLTSRSANPSLLLLQGDLGAGKTALVQGVAAGLGIDEPVTSPSFALAQHYEGHTAEGRPTLLVHLDLYRLELPAAADELFAQEEEEAAMPSAAARAVVLAVEWPERLSSPPAGAWLVQLHHASAGRRAQLTAPRG